MMAVLFRTETPQEQTRVAKRNRDIQQQLSPNDKDSWRIFRIMAEFVEGFESLAHLCTAVTIFGSRKISSELVAHLVDFRARRRDAKIAPQRSPRLRGASQALRGYRIALRLA